MEEDTRPLAGRNVVVTGGNGGLGLGLAFGVAEAGAQVSIWGRNEMKNQRAVEQLRDAGHVAESFTCDVSSDDQVANAMALTLARFERVDAMFANAGVGGGVTPFIDLTTTEWRAVMAVDLDGAFVSLRAAARQMVEAGNGGALIGISSIGARHGSPFKIHYSAAKAAIEAMMRGLAVELAPHRIRCNSLAPGWMDTEMLATSGFGSAAAVDRVKAATVRRTPVKRWGTAADLHAVAAFLVDPELTFHTGDTIVVDGGYTIY